MRHLCFLTAMLALSLTAWTDRPTIAEETVSIDSDSFAAIAFSPKTNKYAYAYNYGSRKAAEAEALRRCPYDDAKIAGWVNDGFCALALGKDSGCYGCGYDFGAGSSNTNAQNRALAECDKRTTESHVVLCLTSDGDYIYEPKTPAKKSSGGGGSTPSGSTAPASTPILNPEPTL